MDQQVIQDLAVGVEAAAGRDLQAQQEAEEAERAAPETQGLPVKVTQAHKAIQAQQAHKE